MRMVRTFSKPVWLRYQHKRTPWCSDLYGPPSCLTDGTRYSRGVPRFYRWFRR
jgi:hypothetical protein